MGTYDTKRGSPLSPNVPDPAISQDEEDALGVLEDLDKARDSAVAVLEPLFLRIVAKRWPVGTQVNIHRVGRATSGHSYGLSKGRVLRHFNDHFNFSHPELANVGVEVVLLNNAGGTTKHKLTLWASVLGGKDLYEANCKSTRDILCELIAESAP